MSDSLAPAAPAAPTDSIVLLEDAPESVVLDETLVDEVSIDGMCGVY